MRITTADPMLLYQMWLDSSCKYTKINANHNNFITDDNKRYGWIPLANILKLMRITTEVYYIITIPPVGFLLQIY